MTQAARVHALRAYESYYGLVEPPFSLTPGLRFAYKSRSYTSALGEVRDAVHRGEGLIVVTGEIGTGKTMLCRALAEEHDARTFASLITDPCATAEEMLVQILSDFGLVNRDALSRELAHFSRHRLLSILQRFLASMVRLGGRAVVVIDEAQHVHPAVLEQIRLWSNFETNESKLLHIVLVGQPELDELLGRPEMRQIRQRVSRRCELTPLSSEEVAEYVEHRLSVARGGSSDPSTERPRMSGPLGVLAQAAMWHPRITPAAIRLVSARSGGIPRVVNLLCDRALEIGCERQTRNIDPGVVRAAARDLKLARSSTPRVWRAEIATAAAVAAMVVMIPFAWNGVSAIPTPAAAIQNTPRAARAEEPPAAAVRARAETATGTLQNTDSVTITVAAFNTEQRASDVAAQLVEAGLPAFARRHASGVHQVIVGPYVSTEEARAAQRILAAQGVGGTEVTLERMVAGPAVPEIER